MEYFPLHQACPLHSIDATSDIVEAQQLEVHGVSSVYNPRAGYLAFCEQIPAAHSTHPITGAMVLVPHDIVAVAIQTHPDATWIPVDDPRAVFIDAVEELHRRGLISPSSSLSPRPAVSPDARVGKGAVIEAAAQIDSGVIIGEGAIVHGDVWLKRGARVGENCVIGSSGINAYVGQDGRRRGFPHLAGVIVGEDTTIGACCVVTRGILTSTRIGRDSIIGNMCNLGHGVEIERDAWISAGTMIGGHTRIGAKSTIAMGSVICDNVRIGEGANIGMGSVVTKNVPGHASVFGNPARRCARIAAGPRR